MMKEQFIWSERMKDEELVNLIIAGDRQKFRELILRHQDLVYGYLRQRRLTHEVAEEFAQETFIRAYRNLNNYRQDSKFSSWLISIALNLFRNYYNSAQYQKDRASNLELDSLRQSAPGDLEKQLEIKERLESFQDCYLKLQQKLQEIVSLVLVKDHSYQDSAGILNIPVGTVRSRLNTARLSLVACMNGKEK